LPTVRSLASAFLPIVLVGIGISLSREDGPKQAGAVFGNLLSDRAQLSDEQRRLAVACGVRLGGALLALEVLRGVLALRLVLPALSASLIAVMVSWLVIPDVPLYVVPPL